MGVAVEGRGWRRALIGLLLLRGGVVGGAGCCSLLCSETIKWTVISPGRLRLISPTPLNPEVTLVHLLIIPQPAVLMKIIKTESYRLHEQLRAVSSAV